MLRVTCAYPRKRPRASCSTLITTLAQNSFPPLLTRKPSSSKRPLHGGHQLRQPALQHVIGGATLKSFNRHLLPQRTRHENEGNLRAFIPRDRQRREAVEGRQPVIAQNEIRGILLQFVNECVSCFHTLG